MQSSIRPLAVSMVIAALFLWISLMPAPCQAGFVPTLKLEQEKGSA